MGSATTDEQAMSFLSGLARVWVSIQVPGTDFRRFIADGAALRDRLRSATDGYFDLGNELVEVDGVGLSEDEQPYVGQYGPSGAL